MASRSLGTLTLDLIARIGGFTGPMDKAGRETQKQMAEIRKHAERLGAAVGASFAAIPAVVAGLVTSSAAAAKEISNLSALAGLSTTEFQRYAAAAASVGVQQDKLSDIFKDTNDKVGDFLATGGGELKNFFETVAPKVGVTAEQFRKLNSADALQLYVSSLQKANVSQAQMTFFMEAIADEATALVPLLADGGKKFKELGDAAQSAGMVMDEQTIGAAQQFSTELTVISQYASSAKTALAAEFMPVLAQLAKDLADTSREAGGLRNVVHEFAEDLIEVTAITASVADGTSRAFTIVAGTIASGFATTMAYLQSIGATANTLLGAVTFGDMSKDFKENAAKLTSDAIDNSRTAGLIAAELADEFKKPWSGDVIREYVKEARKAAFDLPKIVPTGNGNAGILGQTDAQKAAAKAAEAAAKKLQQQFESAEEGYERQIALINTEVDKRQDATEAAKLQFEVESGKLKGLSTQQQTRLKDLAAELDKLKQLKVANEENAKAASYAATLAAANATAKSGLDMEFVGAGMGSQTRERLQGILEIRQEFDQKFADLQAQRNAGDISESLFKREAELLQSSLSERLSMQMDYYDQLDEAQTNWLDGSKDAWQDYADHARDLSSQMYDVTSNALGSLEDELVSFVKTGEFNFSSFVEGIADDLLHMLVKVGLQMLVNAAIGDSAAASSAALAAATGTAMAAAYAPAAAMASLASFGANAAPASAAITSTTGLASSLALVGMAHDGIDSVPREGTWLLQKGERVTTAGTSAKLDRTLSDIQAQGGSRSLPGNLPPIQQHFQIQGSADDATLARIREAASQGAQAGYQMVLKDFKNNGPARQMLRKG
ncbi:phage tail tape measure protein [Pseudomonas sp. BYT-5]|uniref:phage tail tape measure protein n=1 Tax=unclassified Pseudomonas TaxID=196821 RepID=UPI0020227F95|nr:MULTISPECIES: phage tail tape measure protein [unclassified Pseudomonas]URD40649.1 phage tail tape measure protein [Pseudomonas sp. BYT-5]URK96009.1 phage tail tape measure protein [Pseudomonas sp. BYT-1]